MGPLQSVLDPLNFKSFDSGTPTIEEEGTVMGNDRKNVRPQPQLLPEFEYSGEDGRRMWAEGEEANRDYPKPFGFAFVWACHMQREMAAGKRLEDVARSTAIEVRRKLGPLSNPHAYTFVCDLLVVTWKYGEQLRSWYIREFEDRRSVLLNAANGQDAVFGIEDQ